MKSKAHPDPNFQRDVMNKFEWVVFDYWTIEDSCNAPSSVYHCLQLLELVLASIVEVLLIFVAFLSTSE